MTSGQGKTLADQLGITLRGVQTNVAKALRQFQPGGHTGTGLGLPIARGKGIPKVKGVRLVLPKVSQVQLPPIGTSATPGKMAAPHPRTTTTEFALSRGFRNIRKG